MPDPEQDSRTGQYQAVDDEPKLKRDSEHPTSLPEMPDLAGSRTGILRAYHEGADETANRDEDQPAENT